MHQRTTCLTLRLAISTVAALALFVTGTAHAGPVTCDSDAPDAVCSINALGGLTFETLRKNIDGLDTLGDLIVEGDVWMVVPGLELPLLDSQLSFVQAPGGGLLIESGLSEMPWDSMPVLQDIEYPGEKPLALLGMANREELRELIEDPADPKTRLPLAENPDPSRAGEILEPTYLYFHMESGRDFGIPIPIPALGLEGSKAPKIPLTERAVVTIILDPMDPYVYFSNVGGDGIGDKLKKKLQDKLKEKVEKKLAERRERKRKEQEAKDKEDKKNKADDKQDKKKKKKNKKDKKKKDKKKKKKKKLPKGTFAFSAKGGIPAGEETGLDTPFDGHLFVQNPVPFGPFVTLDGTTISHIGKDSFAMAGGGDSEVTLPLIGDIISFSFPLGTTVASFEAGARGARAEFEGRLAPDADFLPSELIPVKQSGELIVMGIISTDLSETMVSAEGQFALNLEGLGKLAGVKLGDVFTVDGELRMGAEGFYLEGTTRASIHPSVGPQGELFVVANFTGNPADSYLKIVGDISLAGVKLGAGASLVLDKTGLFVEGAFETPLSRIRLAGEITKRGPQLTGEAEIVISLAKLQEGIDAARAEVTKAQAEVRRLDGAIDAMREQVKANRRRDSSALRTAQSGVDIAKREVDRLQGLINANNSSISTRRSQIRSQQNRSCGWSVSCGLDRTYQISWRELDIKKLQAANLGLAGLRGTAQLALDGARLTLEGVIFGLDKLPTDADPRIIALFGARDIAITALDIAKLALIDLPATPGDLRASILVSLGTKGLKGELAVSAGSVDLAGGRVSFSGKPEACVTVGKLGEVCAPF